MHLCCRLLACVLARQQLASAAVPAQAVQSTVCLFTFLRVCVTLCSSWCLSPDMTALLDNKARFSDYAASLGLSVPQHHVVTSPAQLRQLNNEQVRVGVLWCEPASWVPTCLKMPCNRVWYDAPTPKFPTSPTTPHHHDHKTGPARQALHPQESCL